MYDEGGIMNCDFCGDYLEGNLKACPSCGRSVKILSGGKSNQSVNSSGIPRIIVILALLFMTPIELFWCHLVTSPST